MVYPLAKKQNGFGSVTVHAWNSSTGSGFRFRRFLWGKGSSWNPKRDCDKLDLPKFQTFLIFQWYKLELEDTDTDTEHCKSPFFSLHGPASASVTFRTWSRMLKPCLKRLTGHHSFQVNVCQPRLSANVVLPRVLQQEECLCNFWKPHRNSWFGEGKKHAKKPKT